MPIDREQVVSAALRLLDEVGLDGLNLRRLAGELGVQAPALYWHIRNKRELLDLMAEAIVSAAVPPELAEPAPGQEWWEWLAARSRAAFRAMSERRDAALIAAGNRPTNEGLVNVERHLAVLVGAGFPAEEALQAMLSLGAYVTGATLEVQGGRARADAEGSRPADPAPDSDPPFAGRLLDMSQFPMLMQAAGALKQPTFQMFDYGLDRLIDGLRARLDQLSEKVAE